MSTKPLSFKEISAIIKISASNGVSHLSMGGLDVTFHALAPMQLSPPNDPHQYKTDITEPVTSIVESDAEIEEYRRAQELITDPEAHESFMIDQASQE